MPVSEPIIFECDDCLTTQNRKEYQETVLEYGDSHDLNQLHCPHCGSSAVHDYRDDRDREWERQALKRRVN